MKVRKEYWFLFFFLLCCSIVSVRAQYVWKNPQEQDFPVIRGRAWQHDLQGSYGRLPSKAQEKVRKAETTFRPIAGTRHFAQKRDGRPD